MMYLRWSKIVLVTQVGLFSGLVALNNVIDYGSNFAFVQHVLSMDTTFEQNTLMWRAIDSPFVHHAAYWLIIILEFLVGGLCLAGAVLLYRKVNHKEAIFASSKKIGTYGLVLGICLWSTGFMTIGGDWFVMCQSEIWNDQEAAFQFIMIIFATLIFLHFPDFDPVGQDETR